MAMPNVPTDQDVTVSRRRNKMTDPAARVAVGVLVVLAMASIFVRVISPYGPTQPSSMILSAPSWSHLMGTDQLGRDIFTRILYGMRVDAVVTVMVLAIALAIGFVVGLVTGLGPIWVDELLMRVTDMFLAFPALILAMAIDASLGPDLMNAMIAMSIVWWPTYARLVRGQVLLLKQQDFVESAVALGASPAYVAIKVIIPNIMAAILVQLSMDVGNVILTTASLSFIGLGAQPPTPELGRLVSQGQQYLLQQWWISVFPGLAIFIIVLCFNLIGDGLRDAWDPRS